MSIARPRAISGLALCLVVALNALPPREAAAQSGGTIIWNNNVAACVEQARSSGRPLMFWVWWSPDCGELTLSDETLKPLHDALRDPRVLELSRRFVTCKINYDQ